MNFKYFTKRGRLGKPLFVAEKYRMYLLLVSAF